MCRLAGFVLAIAGLALAQGQDKTGKAKDVKLRASISVRQSSFRKSETKNLVVFFAVFNDGGSVVNPNVEASHFFINGVEPKDWRAVISNGVRGSFFKSLPPGRSLQFTYALGSRYFQKPDVYKVRWESQNFRAPDITFRVLPGDP